MVGLIILAAATGLTPQQEQQQRQLYAAYSELNAKLREGRFSTQYQDGRLLACEVVESTGDAELDATFCQAVRECPIPDGADSPERATGECMNEQQFKLLVLLARKRLGWDAEAAS
jgi:hypothetical protein